jgi:hypothetical protein
MMGSSCKKTRLLTNGGELKFSTDTLAFDTVFTAQGSFTSSFLIYNPQNEKIKISSIRMAGGDASYFHLNVDGYSGKTITDLEIAPHDSAFVFATVKIDPTNENTPFVVEDKLVATLDGKDYELPFTAYGQNAHYIVGDTINTQTWLTDKPYVIIHSAIVLPNSTLTIPAGCRVYMHADSRLYVAGTLKANGTKTDSVIFQGDRIDRYYFGYEGYPGEWAGLYFFGSSQNNVLQYTIIQNCGNTNSDGGYPAALYAEKDTANNVAQVFLDHVTIQNSIGYGILSIGANVSGENCLVHTCGAEALALIRGGTYNFKNCDFVVFGNDKVSHIQEPTGAILNYLQIDDTHYVGGDMNATLTNCVVWGSLDNELVCNKKDGFAYNVTLDHCLIKDGSDAIDGSVIKNGCMFNTDAGSPDPKFADYSKFDYHATSGSSMIDKGTPVTFMGLANDLDDQPRVHNTIDIGCYEYQD